MTRFVHSSIVELDSRIVLGRTVEHARFLFFRQSSGDAEERIEVIKEARKLESRNELANRRKCK